MRVLFSRKNAGCAAWLSALVLSAALLSGCTSTKNAAPAPIKEVHPLALLGKDSGMYLHIPVQQHADLTAALIRDNVEQLSEANAKRITQYVEHLYIGLGSAADSSRLEAAALGSVPQLGLRSVFTEKNGWAQKEYKARYTEDSLAYKLPHDFTYYTRQDEDIELSFLSDTMLCFAQDVSPLLDKYALGADLAESDCNEWLQQKSNDILFYVTRPAQYLKHFVGTPVTLGCDSMYGKMHYVPGLSASSAYEGNYLLSFTMHVTDKRTMPAFKSLISIALSPMGATVSQVDDTTLDVSGIPVTQKQIEEMFTRGK